MANVLIRDVPDEVVKELKRRAKSHNRPLQQELRSILVETARQPYEDIAKRAAEIKVEACPKAPEIYRQYRITAGGPSQVNLVIDASVVIKFYLPEGFRFNMPLTCLASSRP